MASLGFALAVKDSDGEWDFGGVEPTVEALKRELREALSGAPEFVRETLEGQNAQIVEVVEVEPFVL